ncbi:MAG: hypothetical protein ACKO8U_07035, partial [Pirellula sp.]
PHDNSGPIETWYLTTSALGELEEESRKRVEAWLENHPEALQEIDAIRQTASQVEMELASLPVNVQLDLVVTFDAEAIASLILPVRTESSCTFTGRLASSISTCEAVCRIASIS